MTLNEFLKEVNAQESDIISYTEEAIRKVKQNGYTLRHVKEQTPEICMAAVKRNGYALCYVDKSIFETFK